MDFCGSLYPLDMKQIITILLLTTSVFVSAQKHARRNGDKLNHRERPDTLVVEIQPELTPYDRNHCIWPLPGYRVITCRSEVVSVSGSGRDRFEPLMDAALSEKKEPERDPVDLSQYTSGMVNSRKAYKPLKKYLNLEIDWKREKVAFYTSSTTYKHGDLDSDSMLTGVSISADGKTLCFRYRSTFYGVCQGIAQQMEWYSHETTTYAIVIPNTVEQITCTWCHSGPDCSNIP